MKLLSSPSVAATELGKRFLLTVKATSPVPLAPAIMMASSNVSSNGEIQADVANVTGFAGEYVRWAAGPVLDPRYNTFIGVLEVRQRDATNHNNWTNNFDFYAIRLSIGCDQLLFKHKLQTTSFSDAQSSLTVWYAPADGSLWGYFGANTRNLDTGAFEPKIVNIEFQ